MDSHLIAVSNKKFMMQYEFKMGRFKENGENIWNHFEHFWALSHDLTHRYTFHLHCFKSNRRREEAFEATYRICIATENGERCLGVGRRFLENGRYVEVHPSTIGDFEQYAEDGVVTAIVYVEVQNLERGRMKKMNFDEGNTDADVVFVVGNERIHAWKESLSKDCVFFKKLFKENPNQSEFTLNDVSSDDLKVFLEFIYLYDLPDDYVTTILELGKQFGCNLATYCCEKYLLRGSRKLKEEKLRLALKYGLKRLQEVCIEDTRKIGEFRWAGVQDLKAMKLNVLAELLQNTMKKHNEIECPIEKWLENNGEVSSRYVEGLKLSNTISYGEISFTETAKVSNFQSLKVNSTMKIPIGNHFGQDWRLKLCRKTLFTYAIQLECYNESGIEEMEEIKTEIQFVVFVENEEMKKIRHIFKEDERDTHLTYITLEKRFLDGAEELTLEVTVKMLNGLKIDFGEKHGRDNDVVLVAGGEKFYVLKEILVSKSEFFNAMLCGKFTESEKDEVFLSEVDPLALQFYLELLYGHQSLTDANISDVMALENYAQSSFIQGLCKEFLLKFPRNGPKFRLAVEHRLEDVKRTFMEEVGTVRDLRRILTMNTHDIEDKNNLIELIRNSISFLPDPSEKNIVVNIMAPPMGYENQSDSSEDEDSNDDDQRGYRQLF